MSLAAKVGVALICVVVGLSGNFLPKDDLLHQLTSYRYGYRYDKVFVHSWMQPFNQSIGFDYLAGHFHRWLGPEYAPRFFQAVSIFLTVIVVWVAIEHRRPALAKLLQALLAVSAAAVAVPRCILGRPDSFFAIALIATLAFRPIRIWQSLLVCIGWVAIALLYGHFWIYAIPALAWVAINSKAGRILAPLALVGCFGAWFWYAGTGNYGRWLLANFDVLMPVPASVDQEVEYQRDVIGEYRPLYIIIFYNNGLIVLVFAWVLAILIRKQLAPSVPPRKKWKPGPEAKPWKTTVASMLGSMDGWRTYLPLYATVPFILMNVIRYGAMIGLLLAVQIAELAARHLSGFEKLQRRHAVLVFLLTVSIIGQMRQEGKDFLRIDAPPNAVVFTEMSELMYETLYWNEDVRVCPSFNFTWNTPEMQRSVASLHRGMIDWQRIRERGFDCVIERTLSAPPPPEWRLYGMAKEARIWTSH